MGWNNPPIPWKELERRLSGKPAPKDPFGDAPISRRKKRIETLDVQRPEGPVTPYAELHAHSTFSFLDGASDPRALVTEAVRLGLHGMALTDHDGFYGAPLFAEAGKAAAGFRTVYGAELSLGLSAPQLGVPDPEGTHLLVLARGVEGYHRLSAAITDAQLRGDEKGRPIYDLDELTERAQGEWLILTGCRKGFRTRAAVASLVDRFGHDNVVVELSGHGSPADSATHDALAGLAADLRLPIVATGNVHAARPEHTRLAAAMAAVRARRSLAEMDGWLPSSPAYLRSGAEMAQIYRRFPGAVARSVEIADACAFDLQKAKPELPKRGIPAGHDAASWLRALTEKGFVERYEKPYAHDPAFVAKARRRVEDELETIIRKDFPGYFVIVHDIVQFARSENILCQGRGSAAASAVCYALGITAIDPVYYHLPFARFISEHRLEEPDIDVDFDSDRREEVIQWVYDTYGRRNAAQVANIITYRPKSAVRDAAKALGYSPGQQDAWSKGLQSWSGIDEESDLPAQVRQLAEGFLAAPRHLGIHSGGMILTERPIGEVVPIERARMERRTVLQWDKDGCEYMGLVKFDLLGLGMLSALDHMMNLAREHCGDHWELATIPKEEPAVFDMLCRADSIGVFQVESRAQIGTLPRLRPRCFYDLAIEIALIRPGPIQGGAVHPYVRRATGKEPTTFAHPLLAHKEVLGRTRGVPIFQEQLIEMGRILGDFSADDADLLRRAMGSKRGVERIESLRAKLFEGMAAKGLDAVQQEAIYTQIISFASFGFAESHALSFAKLVYASSWFKLHYPAAFLAGLLRAQPMGFYSPQSLTQDAKRHGVEVLRPSLIHSAAVADLEPIGTRIETPFRPECLHDGPQQGVPWVPGTPDPTPVHRRDTAFAVRLGLDSVRGIGADVARRIVEARGERPFRDQLDLSRRAGLERAQLEALATAGVFAEAFGGQDRRQALWAAGWTERPDQLEGVGLAVEAPELPAMDAVEETLADLWATGVSPDGHPFAHVRARLGEFGIPAINELPSYGTGRTLTVAGLVTHRQRPGTAGGVTFLNLEDETGMLNVVCNETVWAKHRTLVTSVNALLIEGRLERSAGATNLIAIRIGGLAQIYPEAARALAERHRSRDFR
ncbi:error-prone DNA polymerase [Nocardioides nematodiphilus]|uniref:error-prone DNA polymerase n=1 Tax=Nocardioides nematodiphilus TaxID=2849669 RepID=UPI001CD97515|nr:error-prone DNA polymerase [Nocardioides nematodiphilus]MCA1983903.1 error-prone DNA polymerase [Nocardioides nematodiphilus]